jgi:hypothetical protein
VPHPRKLTHQMRTNEARAADDENRHLIKLLRPDLPWQFPFVPGHAANWALT